MLLPKNELRPCSRPETNGCVEMTRYLIKRIAMMIATLFMIDLLSFVLMHVVPGGPFTMEKQVPQAVLDCIAETQTSGPETWNKPLVMPIIQSIRVKSDEPLPPVVRLP